MSVLAAVSAGVLAQTPPGADRGEEFGKTSPIALVVILLLLIATILLIRSMGKHLRKVPESFDEPEEKGAAAESDEAGDAGGSDDGEGASATPEGHAGSGERHTP